MQGCTRLAVKLDFLAGMFIKAVEATGTVEFRGIQASIGEILAWRNMFWALTDAMCAQRRCHRRTGRSCRHRSGVGLPDPLEPGYPAIKDDDRESERRRRA